jgi:hypothetical protein
MKSGNHPMDELFIAEAIIRQVLRRMPDAPDRLLIAPKYSGSIEGRRLNQRKNR